ncbi:MAG: gamma-glutamyltransferase, partial [Burkholderiaceae bacterium]|nr:gamma-glutamyltransferase [Burkholderiaceae bacterium]
MNNKKFLAAILALLLAGCAATPATNPNATPQIQTGLQAPEASSGYQEKPGWKAKHFMVAAANPLATDAGYRILKQGGSAIDAAIATQMVLNLVEPQSSGIGGGAFMLYFDGETVSAYDGRETAPMSATEKLFQTPDGRAMNFYDGVVGGRSVGAPGVLRMLELAHRKYGKLPWAELFQPAIELADKGFAVSPRLNKLLNSEHYLQADPVARAYFFDEKGQPWPVGHILKNPDLARVLREIAKGGADAFYNGHISHDIEVKVHAHPSNPGFLTAADIAAYQAKVRAPICTDYKAWTVCGAPPPSSGGIAIAQMLGVLSHTDIDNHPPKDGQYDAQAVHLFTEAGRLAYADRNHYVADPDFV